MNQSVEEAHLRNWKKRYTQQSSEAEEDDETGGMLPVLTKSGKWKLPKRSKAYENLIENSSFEDNDSGGGADFEDINEEIPSLKSFSEVKAELADISIALTENTEANIGRLKEMFAYVGAAYLESKEYDIPRWTLVSLVAVFKDILPGYSIRPLTEMEKQAKISKQVKKQRTFDETILNAYHRFYIVLRAIILDQPENLAKAERKATIHHSRKVRSTKKAYFRVKNLPLVEVAVFCVHQILSFGSHFNYFAELLRLAMHSLNFSPYASLVEETVKALQKLLESDETGMVTRQVMQHFSQLIHDCDYRCPALWLRVLETVRIRGVDAVIQATRATPADTRKRQNIHMSKRERKERRVQQQQLDKMAKVEAADSAKELDQWNRDILRNLFRIYFGILKNNPTAELLPPVLIGLARHAHQIDVEHFVDLVQVLKALVICDEKNGQRELGLLPTLHCIQTIDRIVSLNEELSTMDLKFCYDALFRQLAKLRNPISLDSWKESQDPLEQCLTILFNPKRQVPANRVAAFIQKLIDWALARKQITNTTDEQLVFCLERIKVLFEEFPRARALLDNEPFGSGHYREDNDDPELCNPWGRQIEAHLIALDNRQRSNISSLIQLIRRFKN